ncbi:MAG: hypothetical protein ACYTEZ_18645 [Planctomycetota bacterium]|jgi:hypothetical protein
MIRKPPRNRALAAAFASSGFVVLIAGITYFAILVYSTRYGPSEERYAAYREMGQYLSGKPGLDEQWAWYKDARVFGAVALLLALTSILFGVHKLARITIPVAGLAYALLYVWGDEIREVLYRWALG